MTTETTPPPETTTKNPINTHEPPSLPNSPLPKRPKNDTPKMGSEGPAVTSLSQPIPPPLLVKKLSPNGRAPTRGSAFAAGYDIYSAKETVIPAKGKAVVDTGIAIAVPVGTCED